ICGGHVSLEELNLTEILDALTPVGRLPFLSGCGAFESLELSDRLSRLFSKNLPPVSNISFGKHQAREETAGGCLVYLDACATIRGVRYLGQLCGLRPIKDVRQLDALEPHARVSKVELLPDPLWENTLLFGELKRTVEDPVRSREVLTLRVTEDPAADEQLG